MPILASISMILVGCDRSSERDPVEPRTGPVSAAVSIPPLASVVGRLLPDDATVATLVDPGVSVHGFAMSPDKVRRLASAEFVLVNGLGIESTLMPDIDRAGVRSIEFAVLAGVEADHHHHDHGDHDHEHCGESDPHLWLDPVLVREALPGLVDSLPERVRERARERLPALIDEIDAIDAEYETRLAPFAGRSIVCEHAAWGRLAARYGLVVDEVLRPLETAEPSPAAIAQVVRAIREEGIPAIFVEPQFDPALARRVAEQAGVRLETLDPLGEGDWFAMMRSNLDALVRGLSEDAAGE